jgi:hypothetical protein
MKNLYVIIVLLIGIIAYIFNYRPRKQPSYASLLRDDLYFYPPRFPIPRPQLRPHEVPHACHFKN